MPKSQKVKYYAVVVGREGPKIYDTWDQCKTNVSRWPGAIHKSFTSREKAEAWLGDSVRSNSSMSQPLATHNQIPRNKKLLKTCSNPSETIDSASSNVFSTNSKSIALSSEQVAVLNMVRQGRSVFFTGSAGTGKSVLLRAVIEALGGPGSSQLAITASTGIASVNIGGTTLHSWAGIGLGQESAKKIAGKLLGQEMLAKVLERWRKVKTLIIDEISMVDGSLFDKLEYIARQLRRNETPFGGIQLVLCGDFYQLPPVPDRVINEGPAIQFAFEAEKWEECVGKPITLAHVFRQKDQKFVDMLNAMRFGNISSDIAAEFKKLERAVKYEDGIEPTELFATRREVDNANNVRLKQLPGEAHTYSAADSPGYDSKGQRISQQQMERLLERLVVTQFISLKINAQVMLIKNLIQGHLVNGSVGKVVGFYTSKEALNNHTEIAKVDDPRGSTVHLSSDQLWPAVQFSNGRTILCVPAEFTVNSAQGDIEARREQIPLILAWAMSVHKSQGQTLERVKVDLGSTFEKGQAYVALSRACALETLQVLRFNASKVVPHPRVLAWHRGQKPADDFYDEMDDDDAMAAYYDDW